ncbi:MAG: hypothetical protein ABSH47_23130 [Bryobacteraceae bacterium]
MQRTGPGLRRIRKKVHHPPADALHITGAGDFRAARIPANIPSISAPAWLVLIGSRRVCPA